MNPSCLRPPPPSTILLLLNAARRLPLFVGAFVLTGPLSIGIAGNHPDIWWGDMRSQPIPIREMAIGLFGVMVTGLSISPLLGAFRKDEIEPDTEVRFANSLEMLRASQVLGCVIAAGEFHHLPRVKSACHAHGKRFFPLTAWRIHPARRNGLRSVAREAPFFRTCFAQSVSTPVFT